MSGSKELCWTVILLLLLLLLLLHLLCYEGLYTTVSVYGFMKIKDFSQSFQKYTIWERDLTLLKSAKGKHCEVFNFLRYTVGFNFCFNYYFNFDLLISYILT